MMFRLTIVGDLTDQSQIQGRAEAFFRELQAALGEACEIGAMVSPSYTSGQWQTFLQNAGCQVSNYCMAGDERWDGNAHRIIREDTRLRGVLGEAICDRADLILAVWNEDVAQMETAVWELLQLAHGRKTPCVWISSRDGRLYWSEESYFEPYDPRHLESLCGLFGEEEAEPAQVSDAKIPLLGLGNFLRKRFLKKYSAMAGKVDPEKDVLMKEDFVMEHTAGEPLRRALLTKFRRFDDSAIDLNGRYQAVIYWRAILPFITSVFLAVGFYAENVLGVLAMPEHFWTVVAGIGFLVHGLLNLYVYILSRSETIKQWHRGFLDDRYVAEMLRVLVHFAPYGVHLNLRKLSGGNERIYRMVRRMTEEAEPQTLDINKSSADALLTHLEQMLQDQVSYHAFSRQRYHGIVDAMDKWFRCLFLAGFAAVILRGIFQFAWVIVPVGAGFVGAVPASKFAGSFANMVALMLPAWASHFATKSSQCNFRYNRDNHDRMHKRMKKLLDRIRMMRQSGRDVPLEALDALGEEVAEAMLLEDTSAWHRQYMGTTVKHL